MSAVSGLIPRITSRLSHPAGTGTGMGASPKALSAADLETIADGFASVVRAESVPLEPGSARSCTQLVATDAYEVWLIGWAAVGGLDLHDHGGSTGLVRVVSGGLMETYTDLTERQPLQSNRLSAGESLVVSATRVHEVWNPGPEQAVSVHVYSPLLTSMIFYDRRPDNFLAVLRSATNNDDGRPAAAG